MLFVRRQGRSDSCWLALAGIVLLGACAGPAPESDPDCRRAPGAPTAPASIDDAVTLANALFAAQIGDEGLSLTCFLARLDRPLAMLGANSIFSLQPAEGRRSPRIFIFSGALVMSVAPAGSGRHLLELAEYTGPTRSIKGEIAFPVTAPLAPRQPYDRIRAGTGTSCGSCHREEAPAPEVTITNGFASSVLKPRPADEVSLPFLQQEDRTCDDQTEPERCAMLNALFRHGAVSSGAFAPEVGTIYD